MYHKHDIEEGGGPGHSTNEGPTVGAPNGLLGAPNGLLQSGGLGLQNAYGQKTPGFVGLMAENETRTRSYSSQSGPDRPNSGHTYNAQTEEYVQKLYNFFESAFGILRRCAKMSGLRVHLVSLP